MKNLEWLKRKTEEHIEPYEEEDYLSYSAGCTDVAEIVLELIDQLDEPVLTDDLLEDAQEVLLQTKVFQHEGNWYKVIKATDEPEVLSQEWIDEHLFVLGDKYPWKEAVPVADLQNLLVPKQDEVDRAYKDGYEKGKQHTFYKGYLEGLADKENEPETVADVVTTFWKSFERLKEVMSMEVEELEEC